MTNKGNSFQDGNRPLTAAELGRYLKRLSSIQKDAQTGNRALSESLQELGAFLIASKAETVKQALTTTERKSDLELPVDPQQLDQDITISEIISLLERDNATKVDLVRLGENRFGIPESKLKKLSRESLIKTIRAALDHERSIKILSDEASKDGQKRTS